MRFDIAFFLCCCRSFLSSNGRDEDESFYDLLGVTPKATPDELKRAYKRQSLLMHPDKLAQKGQSVTGADRDRFTRMRHAYEVLSDPRRRETYDAIGERGMKWVEEPLSVDPQELAHNFATSSIVDRSKIFAIFLAIYVAVFLLPILVCLMADGTLGEGAKWVAILTPLWVWDVFILFYHSRVILMGPIKRPDHIPEEEWVDPLPMWRRITAMVRFAFLVLFQLLLALRLDGYIGLPWSLVFVPMYVWDAIALRRKVMLANMSVVTHDELELAIGKKFMECTPAEREDIHRRYIVVPAKSGSVYDSACRLKNEAKMDIVRILARVTFTVLLVLNLDLMKGKEEMWSWWLVFLPIFAMAFCIIGSAFRTFARTQAEAVQRDPAMFGLDPNDVETPYAKMDGEGGGKDGIDGSPSPLIDEEKEELKAKVAQSAYRAVGTCFSQCFFVVIMCVLIAKIEGASYSSLVIISPFLAAGGVLLCCLACTIFCISEVDENAGMAEFDTAVDRAAAAASGYGSTEKTAPVSGSDGYNPPSQQDDQQRDVSSTATTESDGASSKSKQPPSSTWDPERGEIWENTTVDEEERAKAAAAAEDEAKAKKEEEQKEQEKQPTIVEQNPSIPSVTSSLALKHPGNHTYRNIVALNKEHYATCAKHDKLRISKSIVAAIREVGGRFLEREDGETSMALDERDADGNLVVYRDLGNKRAIEKTSQALREGQPKLLKKIAQRQVRVDAAPEANPYHHSATMRMNMPPVRPRYQSNNYGMQSIMQSSAMPRIDNMMQSSAMPSQPSLTQWLSRFETDALFPANTGSASPKGHSEETTTQQDIRRNYECQDQSHREHAVSTKGSFSKIS